MSSERWGPSGLCWKMAQCADHSTLTNPPPSPGSRAPQQNTSTYLEKRRDKKINVPTHSIILQFTTFCSYSIVAVDNTYPLTSWHTALGTACTCRVCSKQCLKMNRIKNGRFEILILISESGHTPCVRAHYKEDNDHSMLSVSCTVHHRVLQEACVGLDRA